MKPDPVCAYCLKPGKLARDHVVPRSRGGNSAKGDQLASEWLGERCPREVLLIEARVNAKLKAIFARRDRKAGPPEPMFALTTNASGRLEYVGRVVTETPEAVRVEPVNILMLWAGVWQPSGELVDVPRARCRVFLDRDSCLDAYDRACAREERAERV